MRILCVSNTSDLYGASRCIERVFGRFAEDGYEVHVVVPMAGPLTELLEKKGIYIHVQPKLSILDRGEFRSRLRILRFAALFPVSVAQIAWLVIRSRIDVIHTNTVVLPSSGVAALLTGRPHVWHVRELLCEFGSLWKPYQRYVGFFSTVAVAISQCVREQFDPCVRGKVRVVYDGLDDSFAGVDAKLVDAFRSRFAENELLVGVIGRIKWHRKGQEILVKAASLLRARYPRVHYVIVGSASPGNEDHEVRLRRLISELKLDDQFTLYGETDSPISAFAAMDIAVVPPVQAEPFGVVVLEAMCAGTPVIGSDRAGIAEQIVDGESGLLFTPGDPASLADRLARLFEDASLRRRLATGGLERVSTAFSFLQTYGAMRELFAEVTGTPFIPSRSRAGKALAED